MTATLVTRVSNSSPSKRIRPVLRIMNALNLRIQQRLFPQVKTVGGTVTTFGSMWDVP